jgi:imidazolonepropionase-like amidohydrolase
MIFHRVAVFVIASALSSTNLCAAAAPEQKVVAYLGADLFDGTGAPVRPNMAIVTQAERIVAILPAATFRAPKGAETVNVRGRFLIPGLINSHVHLATLADPPAAKAYLRRELYSGITALRDMAGDARLLSELKREAEFDEIPSPDIYYAAVIAGPAFFQDPRTHNAARGRIAGEAPWMQAITDETNLPLAIAAARGTGATAIKIYADLSAPLLNAITAEAHRQGMLVWAHAAVFPARPSEVADAGVDVMSHACMLGYEVSDPVPTAAVHPPAPVDIQKLARPNAQLDALFSDMKERGTILDATLYVYSTDDTGVDCTFALTAKIAGDAYRAGVPISAGTDDEPGDGKDPFSALHQELALLVNSAGLTPTDALRAATIIGARTIGREKDMGTIEVGKLANFVVLDKNPLNDIHNVRSVYITVKNGLRHPRSKYTPVTPQRLKE